MQQGITPMPDVDDFDPNADPGANRGLGRDDAPLPPDVEDREPVEEPIPEPSPIDDPFEPPPKPLL